ncbi:MAG: hypothetical protein ACE5R6_19400 [Candidatus Heimdallarchaeota archaeon]
MSELSIEDLKKRLEIRGAIIGKQSDRIQELLQKIHSFEKELISFKALSTEKEFRIYQREEGQVSSERLLAEKKEIEKLLEQKNQEILILTTKLEGLSSITPEGEEGLETITFENLRLQEKLQEAEQEIKRLQRIKEPTKDRQDADKLVEKLWAQLEEEKEKRNLLEKKLQYQEQLNTEREDLKGLLEKKGEEIKVKAAQTPEASVMDTERRGFEEVAHQKSSFQERLEHLRDQLKTDRQKFLQEKSRLNIMIDEKTMEITQLQTELKKQLTEHTITKDSLKKLASENQSLQIRLQEAEKKIHTLQAHLSEEEAKEKVVPFVETIPTRRITKPTEPAPAPPPAEEVAPPEGWNRLELREIFESFLDYLTKSPNTKDIITRLEDLRDIMFERQGGGMAVRKCGEEVQRFKKGSGSPESLSKALREMAHLLRVRISI